MEPVQSDPNLARRQRMVREQIRARGVVDARVLAVMEEIPRERFLPESVRGEAFDDRAVPIACGQTISQPYIVGAMTEALQLAPEHRVLEIGTGSGYQTAILARLAGRVYTIERLYTLAADAEALLVDLGIHNVEYRVGDGSLGWPEAAPFDSIIVTAGAPDVPRPLVEQLVEGGRLVIPVGHEREQTLTVVERIKGKTRETPQFPCRFVKLIGCQAWPEA